MSTTSPSTGTYLPWSRGSQALLPDGMRSAPSASSGVAPAPADVVGLREWRIYLPKAADVEAARGRLAAGGAPVTAAGPDGFTTIDPWGIPLRVGGDPITR